MTKIMKKVPAILLAGVIAVAFAFVTGAVTVQEAYAENYGLYVGGNLVTSENAGNIPGVDSGKISTLSGSLFVVLRKGIIGYNVSVLIYDTDAGLSD